MKHQTYHYNPNSSDLNVLKETLRLDVPPNGSLIPLRIENVTPEYITGINDPAVSHFLTGPSQNIQTNETICEFVRQNWESPQDILFGIFEGDKLIGTARLHNISQKTGLAWLGIAIFLPSKHKKGWGTRVIKTIVEFAFTELNLERVEAGIHQANVASCNAFRNAGFVPRPGSECDTPWGKAHYWMKV